MKRSMVLWIALLSLFSSVAFTQDDALLFYLSGDGEGDGFTADYAN